jgi:multidrug efflux pump subunit AcrB
VSDTTDANAGNDDASNSSEKLPFLTKVVAIFLRGDIAILFTVISLAIGAVALYLTPREEEPQIVVPMADVMIEAPGLSAEEVERQITQPLEKLLYQIDGVEYVYSMSQSGRSVVTARFYVGEDREDSLVKLYNKVDSNADQIPKSVRSWVVKPIEIDDVPIVIVTLWSDDMQRYGDHELHRIAQELQNELQAIPDTNRVWVTGGRPREIRVELDTQRMASRSTSPLQVSRSLQQSNVHARAGTFEQQNQTLVVEAGTFFRDVGELQNLVVQVVNDRPVYLKDIAEIIDGPAEPDGHSWISFGPAEKNSTPSTESAHNLFPAVHIAIAKRKGSNAVAVAQQVEKKLHSLSETMLPQGIDYRLTRNYGETANDKVNELVEGLVIAVITVVGLIGLTIGWRAALVVALAIPVCYSLTLAVNLMLGYTINRVTMFALILSLGLLVDDPITDVENIARYFSMRISSARQGVLDAIQEVRPALIMSTLAIIASFLPLTFITGMMGPYMGPMALNVPLTVTLSTVVAFLLTPWMAMVSLRYMLRGKGNEEAFDPTRGFLYRFSSRILRPILQHRWLSFAALAGTAVLLVAAMFLPALRLVPLKMLPYDNKNEFQVIIDMPEGSTLDHTDNVAREIAAFLSGVSEVRDIEVFSGQPSPMDFNGMVRHYFLRTQPFQADVHVTLAAKEKRQQQSHEIVLRLRDRLIDIGNRWGADVKVVEVPPGPPVLSTITAEVYGPSDSDYASLIRAAEMVRDRLKKEPGVVEVDLSTEADQVRWVFETDKPKAALSGISTDDIARTLEMALGGDRAAVMRNPYEVAPLPIVLRLPRRERSAIDDLEEIYVQGNSGTLVQLGGLGHFVEQQEDKTIYRKNLQRVMYVMGEVSGRPPADAIMDMEFDRRDEFVGVSAVTPRPTVERTWLAPGGGVAWNVPANYQVKWNGEGEWKITLDVFRDLGIAFAASLLAIFLLLMFQTGSKLLPIVIMLAIPLTLIGIMPGFWILSLNRAELIGGYANPVFFTATAMIGMIALAGIVVRNSVVLVDFIHYGLAAGLSLEEAIVRSVAVRTRPILLTAGTTLLGNWVITLDPVFSGLAWAIIFGILTSTLFTLIVIPVVYWLLYRRSKSTSSNMELNLN